MAKLTAEQVAELRAKLDAARTESDGALAIEAQCVLEDWAEDMADLIAEQAARIAKLEADAARLDSGMIRLPVNDEFGAGHCIWKQQDLRAAIDAARAKEAQQCS